MLAMDVNDHAFILDKRGALESIASRLAPTIDLICRGFCDRHITPVGASLLAKADAAVCQACRGVLRFIDRTANAVAVSSSIGSENRNVAPRPGTSIN